MTTKNNDPSFTWGINNLCHIYEHQDFHWRPHLLRHFLLRFWKATLKVSGSLEEASECHGYDWAKFFGSHPWESIWLRCLGPFLVSLYGYHAFHLTADSISDRHMYMHHDIIAIHITTWCDFSECSLHPCGLAWAWGFLPARLVPIPRPVCPCHTGGSRWGVQEARVTPPGSPIKSKTHCFDYIRQCEKRAEQGSSGLMWPVNGIALFLRWPFQRKSWNNSKKVTFYVTYNPVIAIQLSI